MTITACDATFPFTPAVIVAEPTLTALTRPFASTVAIAGLLLIQRVIGTADWLGVKTTVVWFVAPTVSTKDAGTIVIRMIGGMTVIDEVV